MFSIASDICSTMPASAATLSFIFLELMGTTLPISEKEEVRGAKALFTSSEYLIVPLASAKYSF